MPSSINERLWSPIREELDRWRAANKSVHLWWRDDDAVAPSEQLDRLVALSDRFEMPVLLAVIPAQTTTALPHRIATAEKVRPCQHGFAHENHATPARKAEFGPQRAQAVMLDEIRIGARRLRDLFGDRAYPVFVPPWNRIDVNVAAALPALGFSGLSTIRSMPSVSVKGLATVDSDMDVMDWKAGSRGGRAHEALIAELHALLQAKRLTAGAAALGILTHHLVHDDTAWAFMASLLAVMRPHPAVTAVDPLDLFAVPRKRHADSSNKEVHGDDTRRAAKL